MSFVASILSIWEVQTANPGTPSFIGSLATAKASAAASPKPTPTAPATGTPTATAAKTATAQAPSATTMSPATYLTRVETVMSLQQMDEQAPTPPGTALKDNLTRTGAADTGLTQLSAIAGLPLPLYSYTTKFDPSSPAIQRMASVASLTRISSVLDLQGNSETSDNEDSLTVPCTDSAASPLPLPENGALIPESVLGELLPGPYGFVAQLNEGRATQKRPTEVHVDQVVQPFDSAKFNFTKAYKREALFQFEPTSNKSKLMEAASASSNLSVVLINISPIEFGHVLLVPHVNECLQQLVDPSTMLMALHFALEAGNPYFRVGYNSLGAYATINHLHFQAYFLQTPFPCERAPTKPLGSALKRKRGGVKISRLAEYPVNGFVIEVGNSLEDMAAVVGEACLNMQVANIPHNLLICDSGARVFLWPQNYAERQAAGLVPEEILATGVNPATFEIAGHMVLKRREDYDNMSQQLAWRMLEQVSLPEQRFMEVAQTCFGKMD
eukprot:gene17418-23719_t